MVRAVEAGVPTPAARWLGQGLLRPEAWAYVLDWVDGVGLGRKVVASSDLEAARVDLPRQLAEALCRIHSISPPASDGATDPVDDALQALGDQIAQMREAHPALGQVLAWLDRRRPAASWVVQVHGDFRTGNFLVDASGLRAVLDWEFAHWGAPEEDLGWLCVRDWRFGALDRPAGGAHRPAGVRPRL